MRLAVDAAADAYAVAEWEERLSPGLPNSVEDWSMQLACEARAEAGHKNGPGAARNPSLVNLG